MNQTELCDVFFERLKKTHQLLELYLDNPTEKIIHDIRVSIRRLVSTYDVLLKSNRTKKSDKLVALYNDFFSLNGRARDCDIILQKLEQYNYDNQSELFLTISRTKHKRLLKAIRLGEKISKLTMPSLRYTIHGTTKLEKRIITLMNDFNRSISLIKNEPDMKQMHSMRKTVKKLRYTIELYPQNDTLLPNLKLLQKLLGDICDSDVFIRQMKKNYKSYPDISRIISSEEKMLNSAYQKFVMALGG